MATRLTVWVLALAGCASAPQGDGGNASLDIVLPDVTGQIVDVRAGGEHEVFVLAFWATWCQPCQQELAKLDAMAGARRGRGLRLYAIAIDGPDTVAQVPTWVEREGYRFDVLLDRETRVLARYNPRGDIPYYVVLDARGRVLRDHQGYMTGDVEELAGFLDTVLPAG